MRKENRILELKQTLHTIKGIFGNIGALELWRKTGEIYEKKGNNTTSIDRNRNSLFEKICQHRVD